MRDLKFRVWSNRLNKWLVNTEIGFRVENGVSVPNWNSDDVTVEQYTGLKDKNGKEIYEGDIVRNTVEVAPNKSSTYKIYYDQHHAMYAMSPVDGKIDIGDFYGYIMRRHFEVIGNVHENGDLLKEEE